MEKITSRKNALCLPPLVSAGAFRRSEGKFLAEGRKLCPELCRGAALEPPVLPPRRRWKSARSWRAARGALSGGGPCGR